MNIYDNFRLETYIQGNGSKLDFPILDDVSMLVPLSATELVKCVAGEVIGKNPRDGYFDFFPVRTGLDTADNSCLWEGAMKEATRIGQFINRVHSRHQAYEHVEHNCASELSQTLTQAYHDVMSYAKPKAPVDYIRESLGGNVEIDRLAFAHLGAPNENDPNRYLKFYRGEINGRCMRPIIQRLDELGYSKEQREQLFLNSAKAKPIIAGIDLQGDLAIAGCLRQAEQLLIDSFQNIRHVKLFEWTAYHMTVAESSFFASSMITTLMMPGEQEMDLITRLKKL